MPPARLFVAPILLGVFLRLVTLTRQSLWVDELLTLQAASIGDRFRWGDVLVNPQGPLPQVLLRLWTAIGGTSDLSLRLWAAAAGILGLLLAVGALRRLYPRVAVPAVWLLAVSPFQIWYSQEVRNYAFLLAATLAVLWTLARAQDRRTGGAWVLHGIALLTLLLCNLSGAFLLPALAVALFLDDRRSVRPWLVAAAGAVLFASPWLWVELGGNFHWAALASGGTREPLRGGMAFHPGAIPFTFATFVGGFGLGPPLRELHAGFSLRALVPQLPGLLLAAAASGVFLVSAVFRWGDRRVRLLFWWSFLPAILVAALAIVGVKAYNPRYVAVSQPTFLLLLAVGAMELWRRRPRWAAVVALCLVVPMLGAWGRQTFDSRYEKEDFRGAAAYLEEVTRPGDLILQQGVNGPLARYYHGPAGIETFFPVYFLAPDGGRGRLENLIDGHRRVWWVGSRLWYEDPDRRLLAWLRASGRPAGEWKGAGVEIQGVVLGSGAR